MIPIPLPYKVGAYAILALALYLGFRQWLNHHDNKVAQETREAVTEETRIKAEAAIKAERESLAVEKKILLDRISALDGQLVRLNGSLNEAIKQSRKTEVSIPDIVLSVPDSNLNGTIRQVIAGQYTIVPARTAPSPGPAP